MPRTYQVDYHNINNEKQRIILLNWLI